MNRLALFDCDGTLVDSGATIHRALVDSFDRNGIACPPPAQARRVIGLSLPQAMAALLPDHAPDDHEGMAEEYKKSFIALRAAGEVEEPLYEGIAALLDALEARGWLLGVATGKSDRGLKHCLDLHGITDRFVTLQTADRHPSKPDPSMAFQAIAEAGATPSTTVVIGDTSFDMMMAVNAGTRGIGVDWGYHHRDELIEAGAMAVAAHPHDVLDLIEGNSR
ncbi:MAG: HAD-IA family hydrolase [Sphingomicrobium sp.]